jgi:fatty acid desaturase
MLARFLLVLMIAAGVGAWVQRDTPPVSGWLAQARTLIGKAGDQARSLVPGGSGPGATAAPGARAGTTPGTAGGAGADAPAGLRRFQHLYAYPVYGITFWVWRVASVADVVRRRDAREAALLAANAAATLALVPWPVAAAGVTIGGFLVGALVSATHQSEEIVAERRDDFVLAQFASTRDADASASPLLAWLWGGMDTQLEHHLFPSMPRYKYAALRPRLQAWAAEHNIEFRISDWKDILRDNYATLRAAAAAEPAARSSA